MDIENLTQNEMQYLATACRDFDWRITPDGESQAESLAILAVGMDMPDDDDVRWAAAKWLGDRDHVARIRLAAKLLDLTEAEAVVVFEAAHAMDREAAK